MRRPDRLLLAGALMILAQLIFRGWALWGSWFYFDDLAFMSRAMNQPFGADYLFESYGGHLMPAGFAIAWVLTQWAVFDWAPWAAVILALQLLASVGVFRLLLSMFGRRPMVLVLLAGYLAWVFTLPAGVWFAAGINQIPFQIALAWGLTAHLAYLRTRRVRHLVVALLWVAAGLCFYEKTIFVLGIYGLVALCWFSTGKTPQRLRGLWDTYRVGVAVYVALGAAYLGLYAVYGLNFSPGETADVSWGPIAWNLAGIAMSSAIIGGPIQWQSLSPGALADPADAVLAISWAAVAGLVYYGWRSRTISKRAWSLPVFTTVGNVALLASARAGVVGPEIAREYRYQSEAALVLVLAIGLAFLPLVGAREPNAVREDAPDGYEGRRTVAAVALVVVALSVFSSVRYVDLWQDGNPSKDYLDHVQASLDEASADGPVPLVNDGVPQALLWAFRYPENTYEHLFKPWADQMDFPTTAIDDIYVFDDDGQLVQARLVPARQMEEPSEDVKAGSCAYPLDEPPVSVPLDGPVIGDGWWVTVDYEAEKDTPVNVVAGDEDYRLDLPAGEHTLWVQASGTFRSVGFMAFPEDSGTCITDLRLGTPSPLPDLGEKSGDTSGDLGRPVRRRVRLMTQAPTERRWSRETWVLAGALVLIVAHLAYRTWATYGGWLHIDDFNFISRMFHDGLAPSVAARSYYGHVMPAAMYLSWLNQSISPWNFLLPATEMVVLQALCDLGLLYLLRTMFGLRPGILPPLALFLASVISLEGSIWWAAAVNLLPLQISLFFGLAAHVVYLRTRQLRHAVAANLWIVAGVAFNEKTALVYGVLGIVTLCYFSTGRSPVARVRSAVRGRLPALAIYVVTGAAYVAVYLLVGRDFRASAPVSYPVLGTLDKMVRDAYLPGLLGGPLRWWRVPEQPFSFAQPGDAIAYLSLALVLVLLWEIRKHRRRSLRGLWVPGYFLLIDVVLVLVTRASVSGPLVGLDYRFQGELAAATAIGLACMTMPVLGATESSERRTESEFLDHPRRIAAATVAVVVLSAWSTWTYMSYWHDDTRGEEWFDALVPQLRSSTTPIPVVDAIVPYFVTNGVRYPENLQSRVLSGESTLAFTRVATDRLAMIDSEGRIVPVAIPPTREARTGPDGKCGWKVQSGSVTIPLNGPVAYGGWWVRIGYLGSADSPVRVTAGDVTRDTTVRAGVHALYLEGGPQFRSITIGGLGAGVTLCTNDVTVGRAVPSTELQELIQQDLENERLDPQTDETDQTDEQGD